MYDRLADRPWGTPYFETQSGSIGKRYRRHDEVGTPFCATVDYDSAKDMSVTVRDRDSMEQLRLPIDQVVEMSSSQIAAVFPQHPK